MAAQISTNFLTDAAFVAEIENLLEQTSKDNEEIETDGPIQQRETCDASARKPPQTTSYDGGSGGSQTTNDFSGIYRAQPGK